MAGGEFRFGTASIYMAQRDNIQPNRTSQMRVTTWTRFRRPQRHFLSTSAAFIVSARGKLGLNSNSFGETEAQRIRLLIEKVVGCLAAPKLSERKLYRRKGSRTVPSF